MTARLSISKMTDEIRDIIKDYGDEYDYTLLDEW